MFSFHFLTVAFGVLGVAAFTPVASLAQNSSNPENCNQPMRDPISYVTVGKPARPTISRDGCWIFVNSANGPAVLRRNGGVIDQHRVLDFPGQVRGLTDDGKILVLATTEAIFIDVEKLISGDKDIILGRAGDAHFSLRHAMGVTTKDNYLFLVQNDTNWISVIDLNKVRAGAPQDAIVGGFAVGWIASLALSPDERYLYVSSGQDGGGGRIPASPCTRKGDPLMEREGTILVVDVQRAKFDPRSAVIAGTRAGCGGGMATSPDGTVLYFADRLGDSLLVFDAKSLVSGVASIPIGKVLIGQEKKIITATEWTNWPGPTAVKVIDEGRKIVVKSLHNLTIIESAKIGRGSEAILGNIPADAGKSEWIGMMTVTSDNKTLIAEGELGLVIVDLARLPLEPATK